MAITHIRNEMLDEFYISERVYVREIFNDHKTMSVARCRVEPGVTTVLHSLKDTREIYVIEKGEGRMEDGDEATFQVSAGDTVNIDPNHPQRITNTGAQDLVFLVVCAPGFVPDNYVDLDGQGGFATR